MPEELEIRHFIPGRARFRVPEVKRSAAFADRLRAELCAVAGVHSVEVKPENARVLVTYDPGLLHDEPARERLFAALAGLFPTLDLDRLRGRLRAAGLIG